MLIEKEKTASILAALWLVVMTVFLVSLISSCTPRPPVPPQPIPVIESDAKELTCADACEHLWNMKCKSAEPTPKGATCLEVCENVRSSGVIALNLKCLTTAPSCKAADECQ